MKGSYGKHQNLVHLCKSLYDAIGVYSEVNVEYRLGEIDNFIPAQTIVIPHNIGGEAKCNYTKKNYYKAMSQIDRAIRTGQYAEGFMYHYQGVIPIDK